MTAAPKDLKGIMAAHDALQDSVQGGAVTQDEILNEIIALMQDEKFRKVVSQFTFLAALLPHEAGNVKNHMNATAGNLANVVPAAQQQLALLDQAKKAAG